MKCYKFEAHLVALYNKLIRATNWPAPWASHQLTGHSMEKAGWCNRPRRDEVPCSTTASQRPPCSDVNPLESMSILAEYYIGSDPSTSSHQALFPKNFVIFCVPGGGAFRCLIGLPFPLFFVALIGFPFAFDGVGGGGFCLLP